MRVHWGSRPRAMNHRTLAGALAPTVTAAEEEVAAIANRLGTIGKGVLQFVDDFHVTSEDGSGEFAMWWRIAESSRRPTSFTLSQTRDEPERWRSLLKLLERANDDGLRIRAQVSSRAVGSCSSLALSAHERRSFG